MSKISFNRLINKKDKNFKIEPIFNGDKNTPLLEKFLKKQTFLNTEDVLSIIKINFLKNQPIGYILIENERNIVGFLGTIFSKRKINEMSVEHCYLHSWVVIERCRLQAFKLILPILNKNIFISTYSPIKSLEGLYKKLEFEENYFYSKIILSFPFFNLKKIKINKSENASISQEYLSSQDKKILNDHNLISIEKIMIYFDGNKKNNILILAKKKIKFKFIPIFEIIYISNPNKFKHYEKEINFMLIKKFKTILLKINYANNAKFFPKNLFTRITKKNVYYFNKPKDFNFDVLYSELIG